MSNRGRREKRELGSPEECIRALDDPLYKVPVTLREVLTTFLKHILLLTEVASSESLMPIAQIWDEKLNRLCDIPGIQLGKTTMKMIKSYMESALYCYGRLEEGGSLNELYQLLLGVATELDLSRHAYECVRKLNKKALEEWTEDQDGIEIDL